MNRLRLTKDKVAQQIGINMVDLMMWLVIAALLLAAAIQGIGYYQKNAYVYQMREAVDVAASRIMALSANDGTVDWDDADTVVTEENAARPNDQITLTVENIDLSASEHVGGDQDGMALVSAVTAAPTAGQTFYVKATHTAVTDKDVVHFFKGTANNKTGTHLVEKDGSTTAPAPEAAPAPAPAPVTEETTTTEPEPTPEPTVEPEPVNQFSSITFTQQVNSQSLNYYSAASSADGNILYAASNIGYIYRSVDSGVNWTPLGTAGSRSWYGLATDPTGTKIVANSWGGSVYISNDSGATWTPTSLPSKEWREVAMTPDGSKIIVSHTTGTGDGNLYVSIDGGATWKIQNGSNAAPLNSRWYDVDISDDGQTMVAASLSTTQIWKTTDGGINWVRSGPTWTANNYGVAISGNGQTITVGQYNGGIETSTDGGVTWNPKPGGVNADNYRISMSDDGTKLIATGHKGDAATTPAGVYTSIDSGATWQHQSVVGTAQWFASAMSSDGKKMVIGSISGKKLWTGTWGPGSTTAEPAPAEVTTASLTWSSQKTVGTGDIYDIAASTDGTKMIMSKDADSMYKSLDSGATWTSLSNSSGLRRSVAMSADGMTVINARDGAELHFSKDLGATWIAAVDSAGVRLPSNAGGWHVAMSKDATRMFAIGINPSVFYSSSNGGTTWARGGSLHGQITSKLVTSDSGAVLLAGADGQQVLRSTDYGQSWSYISALPIGRWFALDVSADGTRMAAADFDGHAWVSNTSGETWKRLELPVTKAMRSITISSDGGKIAVGRNNGSIHTSKDSGATWTEHTSQGTSNWRAVLGNGDGTKLFFGGTGGKLATAQY